MSELLDWGCTVCDLVPDLLAVAFASTLLCSSMVSNFSSISCFFLCFSSKMWPRRSSLSARSDCFSQANRSFSSAKDISPSSSWPAAWQDEGMSSPWHREVQHICAQSLTSVSLNMLSLTRGSDSMEWISRIIWYFLQSSSCSSSSAWWSSSWLCSETSLTEKCERNVSGSKRNH